MDIKEDTATMLKLIEMAQKHPNYELECSHPDSVFRHVLARQSGGRPPPETQNLRREAAYCQHGRPRSSSSSW